MGIHHQKVEFFFLSALVNGAEKHTAGFDAHHGTRRQVCDCKKGLAYQFFRLIERVNAAQDRSVYACSVIQSELQEFLGLRYCFALKNLYSSKIALREGLEINEIFKERFDHYIAEIDLFFDCRCCRSCFRSTFDRLSFGDICRLLTI